MIRLQPLTESSLIVTWLTRQHGLVRTAARGARRPKSAFSGRLDLYFGCRLDWTESRRSDLHPLREVDLREPRLPLRQHWDRLRAAAWFSHLLLRTLEPDAAVPELHELLSRALDYLVENEASERLIERYENRLARELGLGAEGRGLDRLRELFALQTSLRPVNP